MKNVGNFWKFLIDYVSVRDWNALTAVGTMCPHLTFIDFEDVDNPDDYTCQHTPLYYTKRCSRIAGRKLAVN